jgi:hypothetical protein
MTLEERADLVLAFARVLYVNGQSTDETLASAERFGHALGLRIKVMTRWGELQLQAQDTDTRLIAAVAADPTGVVMGRVASTVRTIEDLGAGRLAPTAAKEAIRAISQAPPAPTWLFTLAAAAGAARVSGDLRRPTSVRGGSHLRECSRCHSAPELGALQCKRLPATILRGLPRRRYRCAGGSIPVELVT